MKPGIAGLRLLIFLLLGTFFYSQAGAPPNVRDQRGVESSSQASDLRTAVKTSVRSPLPNGDSPESPPCYRTVERLLEEFLGGYSDRSRGDTPAARSSPAHEPLPLPDVMKLANGKGYSLRFLIATVLDPIDSQSGWRYDLFLDAIQRALEANNYVQDRFSIPWLCASEQYASGVKGPPTLQEERPGIILFRNNSRLLVLFLVGETPTSGIQKKALTQALDYMEACKEWDREVRIIGPSASGSAQSLRIAIEDWHDKVTSKNPGKESSQPDARGARTGANTLDNKENRNASPPPEPHFSIISGSATNRANKNILERGRAAQAGSVPEDAQNSVPEGFGKRMPSVHFQATVVPDDIALERFKGYLRETEPNARVALLREANTSYSRSLKRDIETAQGVQTGPAAENWTQLLFPMHISQLRSAYESDQRSRGRSSPNNAGSFDLSQRNLDLPLNEIGEPREVPPSLTPLITAGVVDMVLANILSTISRDGVEYVGLVATDTRDKLFLARQIHKYCPDVRLFTLESDILFTHPDYSQYLEGMIVVSTYPLINENQSWIYPFRGDRRIQFPLHGVEGAYNATLAFLNEDDAGRASSEGSDNTGPGLVEYAPPFTKSEAGPGVPPIWLTVIGHGQIWPLRVYKDTSSQAESSYVFQDKTAGAVSPKEIGALPLRATPLGLPSMLFILFSIVCLGSCIAYWRKLDHVSNGLGAGLAQLVGVFHSSGETRERYGFWVTIYFLALTDFFATFGSLLLIKPSIDLRMSKMSPSDIVRMIWITVFFGALAATALSALVKAIYSGTKLFAGRAHNETRYPETPPMTNAPGADSFRWKSLRTFVLISLFVLSTVFCCFLAFRAFTADVADSAIFYYRATSLASGVSPVVPLAFLGFGLCLWILLKLERLRLLQSDLEFPLSHGDSLPYTGVRTIALRIKELLKTPCKSLPRVPFSAVVMVLFVLPFTVFSSRFLPTFEGRAFDAFFLVALGMLYLCIVTAFYQFLCVWLNFRHLLHRLASHPMAGAFDRLPASPRSSTQFWARLPVVEELRISAIQLLFLLKSSPYLKIKLAGVSDGRKSANIQRALESKFASDFNAPATVWENDDSMKAVHHHLAAAARTLVDMLEEPWAQRIPAWRAINTAAQQPRSGDTPGKAVYEMHALSPSENDPGWIHAAESLIAVQLVAYMGKIFNYMRNLITFATTAAFVLLLAITSYPFQPQQLLTVFLWGMILSVVISSVTVFVQVERDEVLCRIAKTSPNRITFDRRFLSGLVTYGLLPVLGLLFTQLPALQGVFSWVEPVLRAFK